MIWDSLSYNFRLIISFRRDKLKVMLPVLSAWRQISHSCPENKITDTSDKSTKCTFETQPSTPDSANIWRKYANGHLPLLRPDPDFFFFFFACRTPNECDKCIMKPAKYYQVVLMALAWRKNCPSKSDKLLGNHCLSRLYCYIVG